MNFAYLAVEDALSEFAGVRLLQASLGAGIHVQVLGKRGSGYLKSRVNSFIEIAARDLVLLITDLDQRPCAPSLIGDWLGPAQRPENLHFRVAVREVESWLLADREGLAGYLGVRPSKIPKDPDLLEDPKRMLIDTARRSKRRQIRDQIVPEKHSRAKQGLGYNEALQPFVENHWSIERAVAASASLKRAAERLARFRRAPQ